MKKSVRIMAVALALLMVTFVFASCGKTISGTYEAEIDVVVMKYTASYDFSGSKVNITKKTTTILGTVDTTEFAGTYEIAENDDGTMEITISLETEDDQIKSGTYAFEEGEDYIKIGIVQYNKVDK